MLELGGCIVTIDAIGCQKENGQKIVHSEANYLLAVAWAHWSIEHLLHWSLDVTLRED